MTPDQITAILSRLDVQDEKLDHLVEEQGAIKREVAGVKEQTTATNGRVRKIELWQARIQGAQAAYGWVTPAGVGVVCAIAGAIATRLLG